VVVVEGGGGAGDEEGVEGGLPGSAGREWAQSGVVRAPTLTQLRDMGPHPAHSASVCTARTPLSCIALTGRAVRRATSGLRCTRHARARAFPTHGSNGFF
jgi:hypothetical protein